MNRRLGNVNGDELLLKTIAKYEKMDHNEEQIAKEEFERHRGNLKFKRLNEGELYEDGDNFDSHVLRFKIILNPYDLLDKLQNGETIDSDDSSESEQEEEEKPEELKMMGKKDNSTLLTNKRLLLKRTSPELSTPSTSTDDD